MEDSRQDAQKTLSPDDLDKLMNTVVFFDLDELVGGINKARARGGDSTVVLNAYTSKVGAQRNDRYKQTCSESSQANR